MRFLESMECLLLALLPVRCRQDEPDQQFSRLDDRFVAVLQHLDPLHRATGETLGHLFAELLFEALDGHLIHANLQRVTSETKCNTLFRTARCQSMEGLAAALERGRMYADAGPTCCSSRRWSPSRRRR